MTYKRCSVRDGKFIEPCKTLEQATDVHQPAFSKAKGIFRTDRTSSKTGQPSRTYFGIRSKQFSAGILFNCCPFCGERIDAPFNPDAREGHQAVSILKSIALYILRDEIRQFSETAEMALDLEKQASETIVKCRREVDEMHAKVSDLSAQVDVQRSTHRRQMDQIGAELTAFIDQSPIANANLRAIRALTKGTTL